MKKHLNEEQFIQKLKMTEKDEKTVYKMYYDYQEAVRSMVSHRILALNRGEKEDVLSVAIEPPIDRIFAIFK